eukprot:9427674-Ditylum_brightwellii.AAC.2
MLIKGDMYTKFEDSTYHRPYELVKVNNNGTVKIKVVSMIDIYDINIKRLCPSSTTQPSPLIPTY